MLKIVATIADYGALMHLGADVERTSFIINVPTQNIPEEIKRYLGKSKTPSYSTLSFSLLKEDL